MRRVDKGLLTSRRALWYASRPTALLAFNLHAMPPIKYNCWRAVPRGSGATTEAGGGQVAMGTPWPLQKQQPIFKKPGVGVRPWATLPCNTHIANNAQIQASASRSAWRKRG